VPWEEVYQKSELILLGRDLKPNSRVDTDPQKHGYVVLFNWKAEAAAKFLRFTRTHINQHIAIVLDGKLISAPVIKSEIGARGQIEGNFTSQEARDLMIVLNSGALPVPIEVAASSTVSATLGRDSVNKSMQAGVLGVIAVLVFMVAVYGVCGLLADLALLIYAGLTLAVLMILGTTLTLPGIAGFILSLGMAVDANVLIFERLKEELRTDKTIRAATEAGFSRAWTAILDSNVTTILAAVVLFGLGTGGVRGFGITLTVGVLCSMFTAITVTRIFINQAMRWPGLSASRAFVYGLLPAGREARL